MYPEIALTSTLTLPTYFLIISLSCIVATLWFLRRAKARDLSRVTAIDFVLVILFSGFLGARILHVLYEDPIYYRAHPLAVLQVWNGGFVYLGGWMAAFLGALLFCQFRREPFWYWADLAAPPLALAYGLGRLGCLLNGCCFGKLCELPWAITLNGVHRHPTPLYATLWELLLLAGLLKLEPRLKTSGVLFNVWIVGHGVGRIGMEILRDDPRGDPILGLSLGIWMALCLVAFGSVNLLRIEK